jgi:hypothetical protein
VVALLLVGVSPLAAHACSGIVTTPISVANSLGTAFTGRLVKRVEWPDDHRVLVFRTDAGDQVRLQTHDWCHSIDDFRIGFRYIVTTGDPRAASGYNTIAWRLQPDGGLRMVLWEGNRRGFPMAARQVRTPADAYALVGLPATDTVPAAAAPDRGVQTAALGAAFLLGLGWYWSRSRRRTGRAGVETQDVPSA